MEFEALFSPGTIGQMQLKNRIVMAPMVTYLAEGGMVSQRLIDYYVARAHGGAALIVVEAAYPRGGGYPGRLNIHDETTLPGLRSLTKAVRQAGAKIAIEINPSRGRADEVDSVSPSDVPHPTTGVRPRPLTLPDIETLKAEFADGVSRAADAGFDAVMVHGASGYLVSEFLSPRTNLRTDAYGGDFRGRARFALDLVRLARERVPSHFPILFRISADERLDGGFAVDDAITVCAMLVQAGADAIDIVSGVAETVEWVVPGMAFPRGCNVDLAARLKAAVSVPVLVAGRINDPDTADRIVASGQADFAVLGRALIADPEFPNKTARGDVQDIRPCIACLGCMEAFVQERRLACTVNPFVGREGVSALGSTAQPKRVLVVGGGPAGMQAAIVAAERGHTVSLWEREPRLGGQVNLASVPPHKDELGNWVSYLRGQLQRHSVRVTLCKQATPDEILAFRPKVVVLATGAKPALVNTFLGLTDCLVCNHWDILSGRVPTGKRVVVIGGGLVGCETAEFIADRTPHVSIVEIQDELAVDSVDYIRKPLLKRLQDKGVQILCGISREEAAPGGIVIESRDGHRRYIEADQMVVCVGSAPECDLAAALKGHVPELYSVGDCLAPARIMDAVRDATEVAVRI